MTDIKDKRVLKLGKRIDTNNAGDVEAELFAQATESPVEDTILDAEDLEYISSAGLRILIKLQKELGNVKVINASSEVYEIFETTGIGTVVPVSKRLREIPVDGLEEIGHGEMGDVYRIDDETIVKVFKDHIGLDKILEESEAAHTAFLLGIPTAIPFDIIRSGGSYGIVYELLNAGSYMDLLKESSEDKERLRELGSNYGKFVRKVNQIDVSSTSLHDEKAYMLRMIDLYTKYLPPETVNILKELFEPIPEASTYIHGDIHPGNALVKDGEIELIDLTTSGKGHPIFDVIGFSGTFGLGMILDYPQDHFLRMTGLMVDDMNLVWKAFMKSYFGTEEEEYLRKVGIHVLARTAARNMLMLCSFLDKAGPDSERSEYFRRSIKENDEALKRLYAQIEEPFFF